MKRLLIIFALCASALAATPPVIFFTDLNSGPNSGGENISGFAGSYVTIYGNNFGGSQGGSTVTLNGASCLRVVSWGNTWLWYQTIVVQLGGSCATGNFVVTTSAGTSNGASFTVRSGNIRCVATTGSDASAGTFAAGCWQTLKFALEDSAGNPEISAGDIIYALNGVSATVDDGQGWGTAILLRGGGSYPNTPMALVAYPGATVTIGNTSGPSYGIRYNNVGGWVFAGLTLRGNIAGMESANAGRIIGNDFSCPNGTTPDACLFATAQVGIYGNHIHNAGVSSATKQYHWLYIGTNGNHVDIGWNSIHDGGGCRGILFHSTGGSQQYDLHVHDNLIYNIRCDGINFATVDPSKGTVEAYNNVIYHAGAGPDPSDGSSNYSCIYSPDSVDAGAYGSGTISVYNNTLYDCGSGGSGGTSSHGAVNKDGSNSATNFKLYNNATQLTSSEGPYLQTSSGSGLSQISGTNNGWYGASTGAPSQTTGNITSNPLFVSTSTPDFHLQGTSPLIGAGTTTAVSIYDHDGITRPNPPSVGAYESASAVPGKPNPPTALTVIIASGASGYSDLLVWIASGSTGVDGYNVYRGTASGSESLLASLGASISYSDGAITPLSYYYYQVTATCSTCSQTESNRSNEVSVHVPQAPGGVFGWQ